MLVVLTGASGAGKTAVARECSSVANLEVRDFDANGVPAVPSTAWRQRALERWVQRAVAAQNEGRDFLLSAPCGLAELSAVPSMERIERAAVALVDVDDETRAARLAARGELLVATEDVLDWARWFRTQLTDPRFEVERVTTDAAARLDWTRIDAFAAGVRTRAFDTTGHDAADTAGSVRSWISELRTTSWP